jgi:hypothetical protein
MGKMAKGWLIATLVLATAIFGVGLGYAIRRRKLVILRSIGLGIIITFATYLYQKLSSILGLVYDHGFPFAWLQRGQGDFTGEYFSRILWSGLLLDIVFWSIIGFIGIALYGRAKTKMRKNIQNP